MTRKRTKKIFAISFLTANESLGNSLFWNYKKTQGQSVKESENNRWREKTKM